MPLLLTSFAVVVSTVNLAFGITEDKLIVLIIALAGLSLVFIADKI